MFHYAALSVDNYCLRAGEALQISVNATQVSDHHMVTLYFLQVQVENPPRSPAVASAEMESVELEMEMPPLDVKIRPSILSNASLAISGESNTAKM